MLPNDVSHPKQYTIRAIISSVKAQVSDVAGYEPIPCSELDSQANMVVLGKHSFVSESTCRTCNVRPFAEEIGITEDVPIVDGAIVYDDSHTGETYVLLVKYTLYIPSMDSNLLTPFIMRMGGVIVIDTPKIHCKDLTVEDNSIYFGKINLRIQL